MTPQAPIGCKVERTLDYLLGTHNSKLVHARTLVLDRLMIRLFDKLKHNVDSLLVRAWRCGACTCSRGAG